VQKALPLMEPSATVILLSSTTTSGGDAGMGVHAASKAATRSLGRTFAAELAPRGIRVDVITPGPTETPAIVGLAAAAGQGTSLFHEAPASSTALKRMGRPEEVAAMAAFLASAESSYSTGAEFFVDGGQVQV
jgi:NAD(P)-dependent dehydrogenase (short-subunit alcohol dehydrogenase family)